MYRYAVYPSDLCIREHLSKRAVVSLVAISVSNLCDEWRDDRGARFNFDCCRCSSHSLCSCLNKHGANDALVSIQFPENVLFAVLNARTSSARLFLSSFFKRPRILVNERRKCTLIPRAAIRTHVGHHANGPCSLMTMYPRAIAGE